MNHISEAKKQILIDTVINEIKNDIASGDLTALDELLTFCPIENLVGYLSDTIICSRCGALHNENELDSEERDDTISGTGCINLDCK